jgi:hypothetical protein
MTVPTLRNRSQSQQQYTWYSQAVTWEETQQAWETLVFNTTLKPLIAQENFVIFIRRVNFKSYSLSSCLHVPSMSCELHRSQDFSRHMDVQHGDRFLDFLSHMIYYVIAFPGEPFEMTSQWHSNKVELCIPSLRARRF